MPDREIRLSFDEFKQGLEAYQREDFENTSLPYEYLRDYTHQNPILYKQFLGLLLKRAAELEADPQQTENQSNCIQLQLHWGFDTILRIAREIQRISEKPAEMIQSEDSADKLAEAARQEEASEPSFDFLPDTNPFVPTVCSKKVNVLPLMCGAGKSTAISYLIDLAIDEHLFYTKIATALKEETPPAWLESICANPAEALKNGDHYGILIVTDRINRLKKYLEPQKGYHGLLRGYIQDHKDTEVCFMTADTKKATEGQKFTRPVLLMTAQRYFSCSVDEINNQFLRWNHGQRGLVIFDEEPPIKEYIAISSTSLNDVDSALSDGIKDSANPHEKQWCTEQWEKVTATIKAKLRSFDSDLSHLTETPRGVPCVYTYMSPIQSALTDDDNRFFTFVESNKRELCHYHERNSYSTIKAVYKAMTCGSLFTSMTKFDGTRTSALGVVLDNTAKLTDINAHAVVLDGTAEISPMYDRQYFSIDTELGRDYRRSLSNLHLKFVDASTSRARLKGMHATEEMKALTDYLKRDNPYHGTIPIFSYMFAEDKFVDPQLDGNCDLTDCAGRFEHLGNIKGRNDFENCDCIAQIGLFLKPPMYYLALALFNHPELIDRFKDMSHEESSLEISRFSEAHHHFKKQKAMDLLTDTEQNMFRGSIRKTISTKEYTYYVFTSTDKYELMIHMANERYYDASVVIVDEPFELGLAKIRTRKAAKKTHAQLIVEFWDQLPPGTEFTVDQLLENKHMTQGQFDKAKENNPCIQKLFNYYRIAAGSRTYRKPSIA